VTPFEELHRYEIAGLLRDACVLTLIGDPYWRFSIDVSVPGPREADWKERVAREAQRDLARRLYPDELALLERVRDDQFRVASSLRDLCLAAARLVPSPWTDLHLALFDMQHDDLRSAERTLSKLALASPSETARSFAWEWTAQVQLRRGELDQVVDAYRRSTETTAFRPYAAAHWVFFAAQAGDPRELDRAARTLDSLVSEDHPSIVLSVNGLLGTRSLMRWRPSREALSLVPPRLERYGPATHRILHALSV
jgi:hypothetical protein